MCWNPRKGFQSDCRKSPCFASGEAGVYCISRQEQGKHIGNTPRMGVFPSPVGVFFQIHGSIFKLHPVPYLGQASESRISHSVLLLGISENPFNGFLPSLVHPLADRRTPGILCHLHIIAPDVPGYHLRAVLALGAKMSGGTVTTDLWITFVFPVAVTVRRAVLQNMVLRTKNAVVIFVIHVLPPFVSALHGLGPRVSCG